MYSFCYIYYIIADHSETFLRYLKKLYIYNESDKFLIKIFFIYLEKDRF